MASICIYNSAYRGTERRWINVEDVNVVTQNMDHNSVPYILFEHKDYPLGALKATFMDGNWYCDLD